MHTYHTSRFRSSNIHKAVCPFTSVSLLSSKKEGKMNNPFTLKDKTALITGAGSGIGKAAALVFAELGAKVAVLSRTPEEIEQTADEIKNSGGSSIAVPGDITKPEDLQKAYGTVMDTWGRLDAVFANAGINGVWAPIEELKPEEFKKTVDINLYGTFLTIKYAVPHMKKTGGSIIITSSVNGTRIFSNSGATAYSCTKAAQVTLSKMLGLELANLKIRVNTVCPGAFESQINENTEARNVEEAREPVKYPGGKIPLTGGDPGDPREIGYLAAFLASDASRMITGTEMWIDGAESLLQG
jgi:NAD(P)-dependent dehydrogenase (short-subunit alcohol dehydrogenase family)